MAAATHLLWLYLQETWFGRNGVEALLIAAQDSCRLRDSELLARHVVTTLAEHRLVILDEERHPICLTPAFVAFLEKYTELDYDGSVRLRASFPVPKEYAPMEDVSVGAARL